MRGCSETSLPSVTMPRVPSDPTKSPLRLYPAELFRGLRLVLMTVPSASTMVKLMTQSFIVPYLTALVPEQFVPTIPPILAFGPVHDGVLVSTHSQSHTWSSRLPCPIKTEYARRNIRDEDIPGSTGKNRLLPSSSN